MNCGVPKNKHRKNFTLIHTQQKFYFTNFAPHSHLYEVFSPFVWIFTPGLCKFSITFKLQTGILEKENISYEEWWSAFSVRDVTNTFTFCLLVSSEQKDIVEKFSLGLLFLLFLQVSGSWRKRSSNTFAFMASLTFCLGPREEFTIQQVSSLWKDGCEWVRILNWAHNIMWSPHQHVYVPVPVPFIWELIQDVKL